MAITITPTAPYETLSIDSVDWRFDAPFIDFFWNPDDPAPADFTLAVRFPDYSAITSLVGFTDWKFEADLVHQASYLFSVFPVIEFSKVEGVQNYQGPVGTVTGGYVDKVLNFTFQNLNLLPVPTGIMDFTTPRDFECIAHCRVTAINPDTGLRETISQKDYRYAFHRRDMFLGTDPLSVFYQNLSYTVDPLTGDLIPSPIIFNYHVGGALPTPEDLFVFRPLGQNLAAPAIFNVSDPSIVTAFTPIHEYYAKFAVSFDSSISGLAIGQYDFDITLGYPSGPTFPEVLVTVPVQLNVLAPGSGTFYVVPNDLTFDVVVGGATPASKVLSLVSASPWQLLGYIPSWLTLSQYSGSGNATVLANVVNYQNMPAGTYNYTINFTDGTDVIQVDIILNVTIFCLSPFTSGGLYFTEELDYLNFTSQNTGTYVEITAVIKTFSLENFTQKIYNRVFKLPLFQKNGSFHLGTIVHQLFFELDELAQVVPDTTYNYSTTQYKPASIDVTWEEKEYVPNLLSPPVLISGGVSGFRMVKGHKPYLTAGTMGLLSVQQQNLTRITQKGVIGVSYVHLGMPQVIVKVNSVTVDSFTLAVASADKPLYSYFRFTNSFAIGDIVEIFILNSANEIRVQRYIVVRDGLASTHILFENDNGVIEPFEFTGKRTIAPNFKFTTKERMKNLHKQVSKVISENVPSIMVNSGDLWPDDHRIINAIINSENVWLSLNDPSGPYYRVDATTSKFTAQDTQTNEKNVNVEFNFLEDPDATIYP